MFPISCKVTFSVLSCMFKAEKTVSKLTLQHTGKLFNIRFGKIRFGIWRVSFLQSFFSLPLENFGMDLRFLCSGRLWRWDRVYCLSTCVEISRSTSDRERNWTFSPCRSLQKMNKQKWNLAHHCWRDIAAASGKKLGFCINSKRQYRRGLTSFGHFICRSSS